MKQCIALRAIIRNADGQVLIIRESAQYTDGTNVGKWDVPGGRLHVGEYWQEGLAREVREETGLEIENTAPLSIQEWRPVIHGEEYQIVAVFFSAVTNSTNVTLSKDHSEYRWIEPHDYQKYTISKELSAVFATYIQQKHHV
jgi:8-oxo-dGTP diphosphatase